MLTSRFDVGACLNRPYRSFITTAPTPSKRLGTPYPLQPCRVIRDTDELGLKKIEEVNLSQGFWGRIFGFGKIRIQGSGGGDVILPTIDDPLTFRREIENAKTHKVSAA